MAITDCPGGKAPVPGRHRETTMYGFQLLRGPFVRRDQVNELAVEAEYAAEAGSAQAHATREDHLEDRLYVGRRARDDSQDLARGRLLLQRLADLCMSVCEGLVLLLKLREQPDVLDGDDGLIGEGRDQTNLLVGKRTHLVTVDTEGTHYSLAALEEREPDGGACAQHLHSTNPKRIALPIGLVIGDIGDLDRSLLSKHLPETGSSTRPGGARPIVCFRFGTQAPAR